VFCSAGGDIWRWLALSLPPVPCRKAVTIVDYSGTGAIISNIVVQESWRQGLNVYIRSATNQISLSFDARIILILAHPVYKM